MKPGRARWVAALALWLATAPAISADQPPTGETGIWQRSLGQASGWWQQSQGRLGDAWEQTRGWFTAEPGGEFGDVWNRILPKLGETLVLEDRREQLPPRAWFSADQRSNQAEINALLDEAVAILAVSPAQDVRGRVRRLEAEIQKAQQEIAELRTRRVAAPRDATWQKTVADYARAIAEKEAEIQRYRSDLAEVRRAFATELRGLGMEVSGEQLELLLSTVVGDHLIDLGIAFDHVKAITLELQRLVEQSGEDIESARRYYGLYVVLLKVLERLHTQIIEAIDEPYLTRIAAIQARTRELMGQTRVLQRQAAKPDPVLDANIEAQELTLRAATYYREYLVEQSRQIGFARQRLRGDIVTAWNTYETVKVSGELVGLIRNSRQLLDGLLQREVPPLRGFQNLELQRELRNLTLQLREPGTAGK